MVEDRKTENVVSNNKNRSCSINRSSSFTGKRNKKGGKKILCRRVAVSGAVAKQATTTGPSQRASIGWGFKGE